MEIAQNVRTIYIEFTCDNCSFDLRGSMDFHDVIRYTITNDSHPDDGSYRNVTNGTQGTYNSERNLHSFDDKPSYIDEEKTQYHMNGVLHRMVGPALITQSRRVHYQNGLISRSDGPAEVIISHGSPYDRKTKNLTICTYKWYENGEFTGRKEVEKSYNGKYILL